MIGVSKKKKLGEDLRRLSAMKKEGGAADEHPCSTRGKSKNAKGSTVTYNTIKRARRKKRN